MRNLEFYAINFMPYPYIPPGEEIESSWVVLPNSHYDPQFGHKCYQHYLEVNIAAEKLGFDGILTNEHHQTAYGGMPNPNIAATWVAAHTERIKIGVMGNILNTHQNPLRVAEDIAMLDVMSGGRVISGFVFGTGMEYHSYGINPASGRERFWEAHDLIVKAWTEPGPFAWEGKHFHVPYVNPWPRPLQEPHPPVWLPGVASVETIEQAAKHRYTFMQVFSPRKSLAQAAQRYYEAAEKFGYKADPTQVATTVAIYVAETDEQARREAEPHLMWYFRNGIKTPTYHLVPPGYMSARSFEHVISSSSHGAVNMWEMTYDQLIEEKWIIVGSPETVVESLSEFTDELGAGRVVFSGEWGAMPKWMALKNMEIMAEQVIPHFRPPDGKPVWAREERPAPLTRTELVAQHGKPLPPLARIDGVGLVDTSIAHVPELLEEARRAGNGKPAVGTEAGAPAS
jgi:alkanesulfonate monooxygenase SsuD/methylene tetrahydromethanopterin reductase-like flavin-dependent oxidoreductase (luciferase family)